VCGLSQNWSIPGGLTFQAAACLPVWTHVCQIQNLHGGLPSKIEHDFVDDCYPPKDQRSGGCLKFLLGIDLFTSKGIARIQP
jgi:hypothetical protein